MLVGSNNRVANIANTHREAQKENKTMRTLKITFAALLVAAIPAMASTHTKKTTTRTSSATIRHTSAATPAPAPAKKAVVAVHHEAVPSMDPDRATAIQSALIKAGYMSGEPSGAWDAESSAAMAKYQADNDWQTKFTPDARALNKLGLGGPDSSDVQ